MDKPTNWVITFDSDSGLWIAVNDTLNLNAIGDSYLDCLECCLHVTEELALDLIEKKE